MLLRVENIHKSYGDAEILKGVSFDMEPGNPRLLWGHRARENRPFFGASII